MMLQLKVIWHLLNLCAIAFAWNVQGSTGFSVFASVEEQNHVYTPSASPLLNGSFVQPPQSSHLLEPPPPRRANIPTQSAVTPSSALPFHVQQSAASPKPLTSAPLHDLSPQKPTPTPPQASVPINVPNPASTTAPLPPVKPHSSAPVNPPYTTYHGLSTSHPAISPSTSSLSQPVVPLHSSLVPPPLPSVSAFSPTHDKTPRHLPSPSPLVQVMPSASDSGFSPRNVVPSHSLAPPPPPPFVTPPITTPSPVSAPQHPLPLPAHVVLSPSPEAAPNATTPIQSLPPLPPIPPTQADVAPMHDVAPSTPAESQFSAPPTNSTNQPPDAVPPTVSDAAPPPSHDVASSPPPDSHFSAPPPTLLVHPPNPQPHAVPPTVPEAAPPSHGTSSSPPTEPLFSAPPPKPPSSDAAPPPESHFSVPPPDPTKQPTVLSPPPDAVPPTVSSPPPSAAPPSHDAASSPPAESFSAPPTKPVPPTVSSPPPNAAPPSHEVASSPPAESFSAPPPKPVPPTVSSPPPSAAPPSHDAASSPPAESLSAPPPKPVPTVSSPPPNAAPPSHNVASSPPPKHVPTVSSPPPNAAPPSHDVASSPPAESLSAPPTKPVPPTVPSPPPNAAPPSHDAASSPPAESFSAPPPKPVPPTVSSPPPSAAPPSHDAASSPPAESLSAPPPKPVPTVTSPPPNAAPPSHDVASSPPAESLSSPPPKPIPTVSSPPPNAAPPSHSVGSSPPAESLSAPPPKSVPTVSSPPPNAAPPSHDVGSSPPAESLSAPPPNPLIHTPNPPPDAVPPAVSLPPPEAAPTHDVAPSSPAESHFSAPPPTTSAAHAPNPPPDAVPPTVSLPPPHAPPSHDLAQPPTFVSAPPPTSSSTSKNASHPPIGSVPSHATAPSIAAEPPITASPPIIHTFPTAPLPPVISNSSAPLGAPPVRSPPVIPVLPSEPPSVAPEAQLPRVSSPAPSIDHIGDRVPVPVAPIRPIHPLSPTHEPPEQGFSPSTAPSIQKPVGLPSLPPVATSPPPISQTAETAHSPSLSPIPSITPTHNSTESISPETSYTVPSPAPKQQGHPLLAPAPASHNPGSSAATAPAESPLTEDYLSPVPMLTVPVTSGHSLTPSVSPEISPPTSEPIIELAPPILALPPPPPNQDCLSYTCLDPYTNTIPGSPCGCVLPMRVELRIGVALYTFFPLVPEFAHEVATALFMKQSQVRVMGANAASDKPDKTLLLVDLVPLGDKFDNITAFLIFERFWNHQVDISKSLFGDYEVLYVQYPGLPASPPMAPSDIAAINGGPYPGENGSKINPLGVDVTKQRRNHRISGSLIAIIVFSAVGAMLLFLLLGWILLFRHRRSTNQSAEAAHVHPSSIARSTGPTGQSGGSRPSFSLSFESSVAAYSGSAKTFSAAEIERATDNFNPSRVLGEGGFGLVYSATLEDGAEVAVKVLKREDQQGGREFLAEIEMLSRLHHRNLVKLIGICAEEHIHCLIYELIPNGSVESHLHGVDKNTSPLDWPSRLKIALGSARGLAYLHEDSSPRVIHRDFKASNILLEADFTPKVSDFGLARTAMDEDNKHISTRVMGTFGYVAPEYAMTGHLLVKSDVYSYGVVLLELLTGRKPVDMSQPSGQENLVAWTRPYLTTKEALKSIVDPNLGPYISFESVAKVAAIASMCVQPEVSHRPFMGEVVQALKLVCNECDDSKDDSSGSTGSENEYRETRDVEKALSVSDDSCEMGPGVGCKGSGSDSFRRHSASGPIAGGRSWRFWKRGGTTSFREDGGGGENGVYRFWSGSH